jgi:hypothetical protein
MFTFVQEIIVKEDTTLIEFVETVKEALYKGKQIKDPETWLIHAYSSGMLAKLLYFAAIILTGLGIHIPDIILNDSGQFITSILTFVLGWFFQRRAEKIHIATNPNAGK